MTHAFTADAGYGPAITEWIGYAHMFVQGTVPGWQYMSHTMMARVPYDPSFQIGAACEVEGDCP
jgi:hypothetical protein